ncbi:tRNA (cmo5U34)-methyltransferase [Rhizobium mongolense subsp. loessense]|uniref:Carboxy-S-adenosyl-L-methionine synthase n=1 Tax=Rhizobium mongolense subsp. loessense TaxID=158890 RepID=A0A1G4U5M7_9HYPH|nr:carboxy-S-adenosyl-L-methionine synthase CmoA [Rhizobium mongolense]SCW88938.1 tRNA (cmo5U34)-methyltransferase [Rhizobium mongolense subsp. loessense]
MNKALNIVLKPGRKDTVFSEDEPPVDDFSFNAQVADVFDDMVSRSVPYYEEMQRMVCELAQDFAKPNTNLYDIGCSTATTLLTLDPILHPSVKFVGVDNAPDMLEKARQKVAQTGTQRPIELQMADLHQGLYMENASVVTMLLTMQFIRPLYRERMIKTVSSGLNDQGCLLLIEKLTSENTTFNRLFIQHYYDFKRRNGYSEIEISKKREALENVLIPYRLEENILLLKESGFRHVEVFFRWYNFCGIVAVK